MFNRFYEVYISSKGRMGRFGYWASNIIFTLIFVFTQPLIDTEYYVVFWIVCIPLVFVSVQVAVKRAHDRNHSFLFLFLFFIPIVWLWPMFELAFLPREDKGNKYGKRVW